MLMRAATEHALPTHVSMAVDVSTKYGNQSVTARGLDSKVKGVERVRNKLNVIFVLFGSPTYPPVSAQVAELSCALHP